MISRSDRKMLRQLAQLRDNRLRMAEYNVLKAKKAEADAIEALEQTRRTLSETRVWCQTTFVRVNTELSKGSITRDAIYKWKKKRDRIHEKLIGAQSRVEEAKANRKEKERQLQEARNKHRESVLDIERLKLLRNELE